ncbi:uncharacterized protein LOC143243263 [Tachypleus tridentatus]|uniref:uncharacterized protein LOC143243263 n=1 Tax=Tachypleus tridentatus TaxID=6853 RepID=UPI003FCF0BBC
MNISLATGYYPDTWKKAIITTIPKKQTNRTNPDNFRPISLLSCLGKLMERIISNRLLHFCESNNILPESQNASRKNRQTTDHLTRLTESIYKAYNNNQVTIGVFLDVKKAFDSVWHNAIIYKLNHQTIEPQIQAKVYAVHRIYSKNSNHPTHFMKIVTTSKYSADCILRDGCYYHIFHFRAERPHRRPLKNGSNQAPRYRKQPTEIFQQENTKIPPIPDSIRRNTKTDSDNPTQKKTTPIVGNTPSCSNSRKKKDSSCQTSIPVPQNSTTSQTQTITKITIDATAQTEKQSTSTQKTQTKISRRNKASQTSEEQLTEEQPVVPPPRPRFSVAPMGFKCGNKFMMKLPPDLQDCS